MKVHGEHLRRADPALRPNGKFLPLIQGNLIEGLLTWFLLRRALRGVVAVNRRVGIRYPRSSGLRYRRLRNNSSEEENIPVAELAGRFKARKRRLERERHEISNDETSVVSDEAMSVGKVVKKRGRGNVLNKVKNLLSAILCLL